MSNQSVYDIDWDELKNIQAQRGKLRPSDHVLVMSSETQKPYRASLRNLFGGEFDSINRQLGRLEHQLNDTGNIIEDNYVDLDERLDDVSDAVNEDIEQFIEDVEYYTNTDLSERNDTVSDSIKQFEGALDNGVTIDNDLGVLVQDDRSRTLINASSYSEENVDYSGITIQGRPSTGDPWESRFFVDSDGNVFLKGTLQAGTILSGTPTEGVSIDSSLGVLVNSESHGVRLLLNASGSEDVDYAGINIQKYDDGDEDWVSSFYASQDGDLFLRGQVVAESGQIANWLIDGDYLASLSSGSGLIFDSGASSGTGGSIRMPVSGRTEDPLLIQYNADHPSPADVEQIGSSKNINDFSANDDNSQSSPQNSDSVSVIEQNKGVEITFDVQQNGATDGFSRLEVTLQGYDGSNWQDISSINVEDRDGIFITGNTSSYTSVRLSALGYKFDNYDESAVIYDFDFSNIVMKQWETITVINERGIAVRNSPNSVLQFGGGFATVDFQSAASSTTSWGNVSGKPSSTGEWALETGFDSRYLQISNSLSDLDSASTARTNLGLEIGSDVQAWAGVLDDVSDNDGSADLDLNSLSINGTNLFPDNDPQTLGTGDNVTHAGGTFTRSIFVEGGSLDTSPEGSSIARFIRGFGGSNYLDIFADSSGVYLVSDDDGPNQKPLRLQTRADENIRLEADGITDVFSELNVRDVATFENDITKDNFSLTTDFSGQGWEGTSAGDFNIRNLVVREAARFRHLAVDELGIIAGSDLRSIARGKIKEVDAGNNEVVLENPRNISATSWVEDDFFWAKSVDIDNSIFLDLKGQVTNIDTANNEITLTLDTTVSGGTHDGGSTDISDLSVGNVLVQRGHPTDSDRQSLIYTTVSDSDAPVQKWFTNVDSLDEFDNQSNVQFASGNVSSLSSEIDFGLFGRDFDIQAGSDYWRTSDNTGSLGDGVLTWDGDNSEGALAGLGFDGVGLFNGSSRSESDFQVHSNNGFIVDTNNEFGAQRAFTVESEGNIVGGLWGSVNTVHLDGRDGNSVELFGGTVRMQSGESFVGVTDNNVTIKTSIGDLAITELPTSEPTGPDRLFTQTASELGGSGTTRVLCISEGSIPITPSQPSVCGGNTALVISWNSGSEADTYDVQRSMGGSGFTNWKTDVSVTQLSDTLPETFPDTTFEYRVRACNSQGCSGYSTASTSTTFNTAPSC